MGYLSSTHVDTQHHSTYLTVSYRSPPDITRMIQNGKLPNPLSVANPDQSWSYGLWFVFFFWKTMEHNGRYHEKTLKKHIIKHPRRKTEGPARQSLVALALTRKSLPAEWQSGPLKNELCDAMWCFDMLCVEMRSKAFQPEFTNHAQYTKKSNKIEKWHGIATSYSLISSYLTRSPCPTTPPPKSLLAMTPSTLGYRQTGSASLALKSVRLFSDISLAISPVDMGLTWSTKHHTSSPTCLCEVASLPCSRFSKGFGLTRSVKQDLNSIQPLRAALGR